MRKHLFYSVVLLFSLITFSAHAAIYNVKRIKVTNANKTWLQIAEFYAYDETNTEIATTGVASAPNQWPGNYAASNALDRNVNTIYHSSPGAGGNGEWYLTFSTPVNLRSIAMRGRRNCCPGRDVYDITFYTVGGQEIGSVNDLDANTNPQGGLVSSGELPIPAAVWLLGPVLFGGLGLRYRYNSAATKSGRLSA